jgi:hypothetical protein
MLQRYSFKTVCDADITLYQGTAVTQETEFEEEFLRDLTSLDKLARLKLELWAYRRLGLPPRFTDDIGNEGNSRASSEIICYRCTRSTAIAHTYTTVNFFKLCTIVIDQSSVRDTLVARTNPNGQIYWTIEMSVILLFGGTELKAQCKWMLDVSAFA